MGYNSLTKIYDWNSTVYEKEYEINFLMILILTILRILKLNSKIISKSCNNIPKRLGKIPKNHIIVIKLGKLNITN